MSDQRPQTQEKQGFFAQMGLLQKAILVIAIIIVLILSIGVALGGIESFFEFFFYIIIIVGIGVGLYILIQAAPYLFKPHYYSPRNDLRQKLIQMAADYKPDNVNELFFMGTTWKRRVSGGKIIGLLGLPYLTGEVARYEKDVLDKQGKVKHKKGDVIFTEIKDPEDNAKKIPLYKNIQLGEDGDTFFVTRKGWFIFARHHLIRCKKEFHSELHGDVDIYDINPVPYGFFEYPFKQIQKEIGQIMVQNQIETILATHEHQHDLISQSVDSAIWFNPHMRYLMKQQAEMGDDGVGQ